MSNNKFFNFPYGFVEENGFVSRKTKIDNILEENKEIDNLQDEKISSNTTAINTEVERSSSVDEDFKKKLETEISDRKKMCGIINGKLSDLETEIKSLINETGSAFEVVANELRTVDDGLKAVDETLKSTDEELKKVDTEIKTELLNLSNEDSNLTTRIANEEKKAREEEGKLLTTINTVRKDLTTLLDINSEATKSIERRVETVENDIDTIELSHTGDLQYSLYVRGVEKGTINIPKDNFLKSVSLVDDNLVFVFLVDGGEQEVLVDISKYIDIYTVGKGLTEQEPNKFEILIDETSDGSFLKVSEKGLKLEGISNFVSNSISSSETIIDGKIKEIDNKLNKEITDRGTSESTLFSTISGEITRSKNVDDNLTGQINTINNTISTHPERIKNLELSVDELKTKKIDWTELSNGRKAITLKNHDLLLGTDTNGSTYNIGMISKWNIVDLGTVSLPINLNTPKDVRPTVQEGNGNDKKVHDIAYLSDVEAVESKIPSLEGYATENWVEGKNYLTEHQDLSEYAKNDYVDSEISKLNDSLNEVEGKIPSLDEYAKKTELPSLDGYATENWVEGKNYLTEHQDLSEYAKKTELPSLDGYATENWVEGKNYLTEHQDLSEYAKKSELPSLDGYATENWVEEKNYLTEHQDLSEYAKKSELPSLDGYVTEDSLINKGYLTSIPEEFITEDELSSYLDDKVSKNELNDAIEAVEGKIPSLDEYAKNDDVNAEFIKIRSEIPSVPTNVSSFENDADYVAYQNLGGDRKAITLKNHDLLLGTDTNGSTYNIGMISKWDIVDLGTVSLPINLNTPKDVRPTVQEAGQSGEEAHKIAYLSDVDNLKELISRLESKIKVLEGRVYDANQLVDVISNLKEGETQEIKLYNNINLDTENKLTIPNGATLNINLNGKTIETSFNDILFRVNGVLNIDGNGAIVGPAYVASANKGSVVNVMSGNFENTVTSFQANGGTININGGYFKTTSSTYGTKYTLNHIDSQKNNGLISVMGGTFVNYDPSNSYSENPPMNFVADGYAVSKSVENGETLYKVVKGSNVTTADEINNLVSNLSEGDVADIYLQNDVELSGEAPMFINANTTVNLNLNGNTFTNKVNGRASIINDGTMTISNGKIVNGNTSSQGGCAILNRNIMTIENGEYGSSSQRGAAVENKGQLTINGGTFTSLEKGSDNSNGWAYVFINRGNADAIMTINNATSDCNAHGMFSADSGVINVNGGYYRLGANGLSTYYMAYSVDGIINLNGGKFEWTSGATNFPTYIQGNGSINISENAEINW